jgi:hypothetical protein
MKIIFREPRYITSGFCREKGRPRRLVLLEGATPYRDRREPQK